MERLRDKLWLWGQSAGTHTIFPENIFGLPGVSRMTPLEGCAYLGIPNVCRVVMAGQPKQSDFAQEMIPLTTLSKVVWSVVGDSSSTGYQAGERSDLDAFLELAAANENIVGGVLDDILNAARREVFTPERIAEYAARLHSAPRPLELWAVLYEIELGEWVVPYLSSADVITFWTWHAKNLPALEDNLRRVRELFPDKRIMAGVYMWDYGDTKPLPCGAMERQLDVVRGAIRKGELTGAIVCSNCIADLGLEAAEIAKRWIAEHGDEKI